MGSPRERQPIREGALTICAVDTRYEGNKPPGPLAPIIRVELVRTPVYVDKNTQATRTTFELSATANTPGELYALLDRVVAELRAAEIADVPLGELRVVNRQPTLLRSPPKAE